MSDRKEAIVSYYDYDGVTDYDDEFLRHRTINNYFFRDEERGVKYRWTTKSSVALHYNIKYKIHFSILGGNKHGIKIGYLKIYEWARNTYGHEFWREVRIK